MNTMVVVPGSLAWESQVLAIHSPMYPSISSSVLCNCVSKVDRYWDRVKIVAFNYNVQLLGTWRVWLVQLLFSWCWPLSQTSLMQTSLVPVRFDLWNSMLRPLTSHSIPNQMKTINICDDKLFCGKVLAE